MRCGPGALNDAHDIAEGGLAVAIAECCLRWWDRREVELADVGERGLFGEAPGRAFVVSGSEEALLAAGLRATPLDRPRRRRSADDQRRRAGAEPPSFRAS